MNDPRRLDTMEIIIVILIVNRGYNYKEIASMIPIDRSPNSPTISEEIIRESMENAFRKLGIDHLTLEEQKKVLEENKETINNAWGKHGMEG